MTAYKNPLLHSATSLEIFKFKKEVEALKAGEKNYLKNAPAQERNIIKENIKDLALLGEAFFPDQEAALNVLNRLCDGFFTAALATPKTFPAHAFAIKYDLFKIRGDEKNKPLEHNENPLIIENKSEEPIPASKVPEPEIILPKEAKKTQAAEEAKRAEKEAKIAKKAEKIRIEKEAKKAAKAEKIRVAKEAKKTAKEAKKAKKETKRIAKVEKIRAAEEAKRVAKDEKTRAAEEPEPKNKFIGEGKSKEPLPIFQEPVPEITPSQEPVAKKEIEIETMPASGSEAIAPFQIQAPAELVPTPEASLNHNSTISTGQKEALRIYQGPWPETASQKAAGKWASSSLPGMLETRDAVLLVPAATVATDSESQNGQSHRSCVIVLPTRGVPYPQGIVGWLSSDGIDAQLEQNKTVGEISRIIINEPPEKILPLFNGMRERVVEINDDGSNAVSGKEALEFISKRTEATASAWLR